MHSNEDNTIPIEHEHTYKYIKRIDFLPSRARAEPTVLTLDSYFRRTQHCTKDYLCEPHATSSVPHHQFIFRI